MHSQITTVLVVNVDMDVDAHPRWGKRKVDPSFSSRHGSLRFLDSDYLVGSSSIIIYIYLIQALCS